MSNRKPMAGLTIAVSLVAAAAAYAQDPPRTAFRLASDADAWFATTWKPPERGTHYTIPKAPAFQDIACRYRSDADAASRLASIVRDGSGPLRRDRHWTGKVAFDTMYPHDLSVTEAQARQIVDWTMTLCPMSASANDRQSKRR